MPKSGGNPFQPGRGVLPPLLAGRERELRAAERALADLGRGVSPSQDLLFYGPGGNGKTTLLLELKRRSRERGFRVETLPVSALTEKGALVRLLQERSRAPALPVTGVAIAGIGVTTAPHSPTEDLETLLLDRIGRGPSLPALVIVLDEAQVLIPEIARPFFEAVQRAKSEAGPFLLAAAGTPDAPLRICQAGAFNERGFVELPVGRLARPETLAALVEPARAAGRPISEDGAALLAEESQDYPYFVQLLGSAAWEAAAAESSVTGISPAAARRAVTGCADEIEDFFGGRYREAEARRIEPVLGPLAALVSEHGGAVTDADLAPLLRRFGADDEIPFDDFSLRDELSDLGVLWEVRPRVWEMGIPGFADYLLRHC